MVEFPICTSTTTRAVKLPLVVGPDLTLPPPSPYSPSSSAPLTSTFHPQPAPPAPPVHHSYPRRSSHALARTPHSHGLLTISSHTLRSQYHSFLHRSQQPPSPPSTASTLYTRSPTSASYLPAHCLLSHPHLRSCSGSRVLQFVTCMHVHEHTASNRSRACKTVSGRGGITKSTKEY